MVISHKYKFVFVEIPHTASHSISEQLLKHYGGETILRKHANVTQFMGQASKAERRYFKFASVRNPLDIATTEYSKLKNNHKGQFTNPAMLIENGGHVTKDHLREFNFIVDHDAKFPAFFLKFRSRLYNNWFLVGDQHFDHVIRFENLQQGFSEVLRRLEIKQQEPIPHVNRTKGKEKSWFDFFTPEIYKVAASSYGPFMEKWGYRFPDEWGDVPIPSWSRLQFNTLDRAAKLAAGFVTLDPDHPILYRAKKTVDFATRKTG
ncbi:MAG: sulfotransferase family 2 domain-containing protein [Pseudomonadota bacterium]